MMHAFCGRIPHSWIGDHRYAPWRQPHRRDGTHSHPRMRRLPEITTALRAGVVPAYVLGCLNRFSIHPEVRDPRALLACCELTKCGDVFVALSTPHHQAGVTPNDVYSGGVAFVWRADLGRLTVAPRLLRLVCSNGQLLPVNRHLGSTPYRWTLALGSAGDLDEAIRCGLSGEVLARTTSALASVRTSMVEHPRGALTAAGLGIASTQQAPVLRLLAGRRKLGWYALLNAITQVARDALDLRTRLVLEQAAGILITQFPHFRPLPAHAVP